MILQNLVTPQFRNLKDINLSFCEGVNVICGENGQGKTNLLENIWLFSGAKSFRSCKDSDLIPFGSDYWNSKINFFSQNRNQEIKINYGNRKEYILNGINSNSSSSIVGNFICLVFSPIHLSLIKDGPEIRRHSLDVVISQVKPRYQSILNEYNKILQQRNAILKDSFTNRSLLDTLTEWDIVLANRGSIISKTRKSYLEKCVPKAQEIYDGISDKKEKLDLQYNGILDEKELIEKLKESREEDFRYGYTTIGPHRDDIDILLNNMQARAFASQGQQRSIVLSLKLGESSLIEEVTGEMPVILLDDVLSELDDKRRGYLLHNLSDKQIFITCCDSHQVIGATNIFEAKDGRIVPSLRK